MRELLSIATFGIGFGYTPAMRRCLGISPFNQIHTPSLQNKSPRKLKVVPTLSRHLRRLLAILVPLPECLPP
jgi:hypothetical protein